MHFSFSLRFLVPGVAVFWFAVVLAIGQLALMVLNISGKYFQQLWLEGIQINSRHLHPLCIQGTIFWVIFQLVGNFKKYDSGGATVWATNGKSSSFWYTRWFTNYVRHVIIISQNVRVRNKNGGYSENEWKSIFLPALDRGKPRLFPLIFRVSFEQKYSLYGTISCIS